MGTIRIEAVPIRKYGLGFLFFEHLQLVYQDETDPIDSQDYWFVLEGVVDGSIFGGTLGAEGEDGRTSLSVSNGASRDALVAEIGTPESRGSRILTTGPGALDTWDRIADYAAQIEDQHLPYIVYAQPFSDRPTINSSSFVASAARSVGIDVNDLMPFGFRISPGASTFIGTNDGETLSTTENFTTLVGGGGDDTFIGRNTLFFPEKFYGGDGDDTFVWSYGQNVINGGQPGMDEASDGVDTVDYSGAGVVLISVNRYAVDSKTPAYIAEFEGGTDRLYSIEQFAWDRESDTLVAGEGVTLLEKPVLLKFEGQSGGQGDRLAFSGDSHGLLINAVNETTTSVQLIENEGLDAGYWAQSVEWLEGSDGGDRIYSGNQTFGVAGGRGDDVIDARLATAFSGASPEGYDVEIDGGNGDDVIVSSGGRTLARGGAGDDIFVLSTMSSSEENVVEYVIADAEAGDRLFVPSNFFRAERGAYEGSELFQLSGAPFEITEDSPVSYFFGAEPGTVAPEDDFLGVVSYAMDGDDLIITVLQATLVEVETGDGETEQALRGDTDTTTIIRVVDWSEGDLGISFPIAFDSEVFDTLEDFYDYPGLRAAINDALSEDRYMDALEARPDAYVPMEIAAEVNGETTTAARSLSLAAIQTEGGDGDDVLTADDGGPYQFDGADGDDVIIGSNGGDTLDGGAGADSLQGGRGNDTYVVDDAADVVIEEDRGGFDRVVSSISYALGEFVEHLRLTGSAATGAGNALRNTLEGNDADNTLTGGDGDDTLAGNAGDDVLIGGDGGDGYVYEIGDGDDVIIEIVNGEETGDDALVFAAGLDADDVTFYRDSNGGMDLIVRIGVDGALITVRDYFAGAGIETIEFADGETWSGGDLESLAAAAEVAANWSPIANDDSFGMTRRASVAIPLAALTENDTDSDGDSLTLVSVVAISGGTATLSADGGVTVSPDAGASELVLDYTISDGRGGSSTARATLTIVENQAPVILGAALDPVTEDQPAEGRLDAADADGDALTCAVKAAAGPSRGTVTLHENGAFTYTPDANTNGDESFTLTVSDGSSTVEREFSFSIAAVNDAPVAAHDTGYRLNSGAMITIAAASLLSNDTDVDGDGLTIGSVTAGAGLTVSQNAAGDIVVTAAASGDPHRYFTYEASDGAGGSSTATVNVDVTTSANSTPVIRRAVIGNAREDADARGRIIASDADGDTLTYSVADGGAPHKGGVAVNADGTFVYTPNHDANGEESFTLTVTDGHSAPVAHEFTFNIAARNDAPVAVADSGYSVAAGGSITISAASLLSNDYDVDGDALSIRSVTRGAGLVVARDDAGDIVVTAQAGATGERTFSYSIVDENGAASRATVTIDVTNAAPVVRRAVMNEAREDRNATGRITGYDANGDTLTYGVAEDGEPHKGTVTVNSDGSFVYTPIQDANGADSFTLTVTDGQSDPVEYTFEFNIRPDYNANDIRHYDIGTGAARAAVIAEFAVNTVDDNWDGAYWQSVIARYGAGDALHV